LGLERVVKGINEYPKNNNKHESYADALQGKVGEESIASFRMDPEQEP
jgi:hypothetical protein